MKRIIAGTLIACAGVLAVPGIAQATDHGGGHTPVVICHKGNTITVDDDAVPAHQAHGDNLGPCSIPTEVPCPTVSPTPEPTPSPTPSETSSPTPEPTPTGEPSPEPSSTSTPSTSTPTEPTPSSTAVVPPVVNSPEPTDSQVSTAISNPSVEKPSTGPGETLAETGSDTTGWKWAAGLFLSGLGLTWLTARRRNRENVNA